jgi:chromate transporter
MDKRPTIIQLFFFFLRLGVTAFGGPAMVQYIKELSVNRRQWIDNESFNHGVALCQTIPGAIAVNMASYVGLKARGITGMFASCLGFVMPAFLLLLMFAFAYSKTRNLLAAASLFNGLQVIVVAIIANAALSFGRNTIKIRQDILLAAACTILLLLKVNPFIVIIAAAIAGMVFYKDRVPISSSMQANSSRHFKNSAMLIACFLAGLASLFFIDKTLFDLAFAMSKIELFAFGGGYTALTLMFHEVVEVWRWLDSKTFMDGVALGQVTPGPILINATFVGYFLKGFWGAVVGTLAIFTPGIILIAIIMPFWDRLGSSALFLSAIKGIITCFVGLLVFVAAKFALAVQWDIVRVLLGAAAFIALLKRVDVLYVVLTGAAISIAVF